MFYTVTVQTTSTSNKTRPNQQQKDDAAVVLNWDHPGDKLDYLRNSILVSGYDVYCSEQPAAVDVDPPQRAVAIVPRDRLAEQAAAVARERRRAHARRRRAGAQVRRRRLASALLTARRPPTAARRRHV